MPIPEKISAYLKKRASGKWLIEKDYPNSFQKIIVVPSIAESDNLPALIKSLEQNDELELLNTLLLIVVNNSISSSDEVKKDNKKTLEYLRNLRKKINLSFIDASTEGKEMDDKNGGVGLARKIGMDLALTKFDYNSSQKRILICTDADCKVDSDYLTGISQEFNRNNYEAAVVNFAHDTSGEDEETKAIICYEIFLRYYVLGLSFANSDYAFHTIGSTMICTPEAYAKVGGMNKRKAAEDFYFLEKLSKVTNIGKISSAYVYPSKRSSWRVPFGTGRSVQKFLSEKPEEYLLNDPESFVILKKWLKVFFEENPVDKNILLNKAKSINKYLFNFLTEQGFTDFAAKISIILNRNQLMKQKNYWFDAFRTLKLIHYLRDTCCPNINMFEALDNLFELSNIPNEIGNKETIRKAIPDLAVQKQYLNLLRNLQR
ncbi:MAG: glycosyltransferase family 2 protein [Ignavibacteriaceae bacterium]|nr:glycosyltransferase family 2 protein [Ignavibacteriaceae bacterium]